MLGHVASRRRSIPFLLAALISIGFAVALIVPLARADGAADKPAADCQPFTGTRCLLPFPNNLFTRRDRSTPTGLRVNLPADAMPVNRSGVRVSVAEYDRNDGFSPGSAAIIHVPGLDNSAAFRRTGAVGLADMARAFSRNQPIVIVDEQTGRRQLIWSELDANGISAQTTNLLIHPGKNFTEGHTYVVVLRRLRRANGSVIAAPSWFEKLRDGRRLPRGERSQRAQYARIFAALRRARIPRGNLYEAWDFTIASERNLSRRLLSIRNKAFAQLGDRNLADGKVQGRAPSFAITSISNLSLQLRDIAGTFTVPCYLTTCGPSATSGFHYSSSRRDAMPTQIPGNNASAQFECIVPSSAGNPHPARISLYGHGLLNTHDEVEASNVQAMATEHNIVFCATDWWGLATPDTAYLAQALLDLNKFPNVVDRIQQGVLNTLLLGRLMINRAGFDASPAFRVAGHPAIDTSHLFYDGNSLGGILGGVTTAIAPDFRHAVLGVSGMDFGNILLPRSTDFPGEILFGSYVDPSMDPVLLDLMQQLWDRGDPDGYAQQMTSHPLPDTPSHQVLMQIAYGDHQVSMYAAVVEARTIGAAVHTPALGVRTDRARDRNLFYGVPAIAHYPFRGSAIVIWDSGPGRVQPPPLANLPPVDSATNIDPHEDVRNTRDARVQKSDFLQPNGAVFDLCSGKPCHTAVYAP